MALYLLSTKSNYYARRKIRQIEWVIKLQVIVSI